MGTSIINPANVGANLSRAIRDSVYFDPGTELSKGLAAIFGVVYDTSAAESQGSQYNINELSGTGITGCGSEIGVRDAFDAVEFSIYPYDADALPTFARVIIRSLTNTGTILANVLIPLATVTARTSVTITAELGTLVSSASELYLQVITDGLIGYASANEYPTALVTYTTSGLITATTTPIAVVSPYHEIFAKTFVCGARNSFTNSYYYVQSNAYSTFSGWGNLISNIPSTFNKLQMWINAFDPETLPNKIRVRFRDSAYNGTVLATALANVAFTTTGTKLVTWFFDDDVDLSSYSDVWFEYVSDGFVAFSTNDQTNNLSERYTSGPSGTEASLGSAIPNPSGLEPWFYAIKLDRATITRFDSGTLIRAIQQESTATTLPLCELSLPPEIYAVEGYETNVYWDGILHSHLRASQFSIRNSTQRGQSLEKRWRITPSSSGFGGVGSSDLTTFSMTTTVLYNGEQVAQHATSVKVKAANVGAAASRKALFIGDSITEDGRATQQLLDNITEVASGYSLTLLGSKGTGANKHEGYSGQSYSFFRSNDASNPFYDGSDFNFQFYLTAKGYTMAATDSVYLMLGTNDFFGLADDSAVATKVTSVLADLAVIIASIHSAVAGINIWIGLVPPAPMTQDGVGTTQLPFYSRDRYARNFALWRKSLIASYGASQASNIRLCHVNCCVDTDNGFAKITEAVNARSATTHSILNNDVHPNASGYSQIGDVYHACQLSLES